MSDSKEVLIHSKFNILISSENTTKCHPGCRFYIPVCSDVYCGFYRELIDVYRCDSCIEDEKKTKAKLEKEEIDSKNSIQIEWVSPIDSIFDKELK